MRRCAVIGSPIAHSLSPLLHRTAYAQLGLADRGAQLAHGVLARGVADKMEAAQTLHGGNTRKRCCKPFFQ